jgi:hypothetical protein
MKLIRNERGIALITALLITMMAMAIIFGVLYAIMQSTKSQASQKTYRTAVEATYAGSEVMVNEILPRLFSSETPAAIKSSLSSIGLEYTSKADGSCLQDKLFKSPASWTTNCSSVTASNVNPRVAPDVKFELNGQGGSVFVVYSKIVDTIPGTPYLPAGPQLEGGGVAASGGTGTSSGQHYVYRMEIAGERKVNPAEKGEISVLYEY